MGTIVVNPDKSRDEAVIDYLISCCEQWRIKCAKAESELAAAKAEIGMRKMGFKYASPTPPPAEGKEKRIQHQCPKCGENVTYRVSGCYWWCQSCAAKWSKDGGAAETDTLTARMQELESILSNANELQEAMKARIADLHERFIEMSGIASRRISIIDELKGKLATMKAHRDSAANNYDNALDQIKRTNEQLATANRERDEARAEAEMAGHSITNVRIALDDGDLGHSEAREKAALILQEAVDAEWDTYSQIEAKLATAERERDECKVKNAQLVSINNMLTSRVEYVCDERDEAKVNSTYDDLQFKELTDKLTTAQADTAIVEWMQERRFCLDSHDSEVIPDDMGFYYWELRVRRTEENANITLRKAATAAMGGGEEEASMPLNIKDTKCTQCSSTLSLCPVWGYPNGDEQKQRVPFCSFQCKDTNSKTADPPAEPSVAERIEAVLQEPETLCAGTFGGKRMYSFLTDPDYHFTVLGALISAEAIQRKDKANDSNKDFDLGAQVT